MPALPPQEKCLSNVSVTYGQFSPDIYITGLTSCAYTRLHLLYSFSLCYILLEN